MGASTDPLTEVLRKGLYEEEANRDLAAATQAYLSVIAHYDHNRETAGTALFRLGECYRKQGMTNEATSCYQRILSDFNDLTALSRPAREALGTFPQFAIGASSSGQGGSATNLAPAVLKQKELLTQELALVEQLLASRQKMVEVGRAAPDDVITIQREILALKRQMAALDATKPRDLLDIPLPKVEEKTTSPSTEEEVLTAAEADILKRFKTLVANSPDLLNASFPGPEGDGGLYASPLVYAVRKGYSTATRYLLENGARTDRGASGNPALYEAADRGHRKIVEMLLAKGADVNAVNQNGETALHTAAVNGFLAMVQLLLDHQADWRIVDFRKLGGWDGGCTPLQRAALLGQVEVTKELLGRGADVNQRNPLGLTALHAAARSASAQVVKLLLEKGADPNLVATLKKQPQAGEDSNLQQLSPQQQEPWSTPLLTAVVRFNTAAASALLEGGAKPDLYGPGEQTPLLVAARLSHTNLIGSLLRHGADIKQVDSEKRTVLHWLVSDNNRYAGGSDREEVVGFLVALGANPNAQDKRGMTPLHYAARRDNAAWIKALIANGADPKAKDLVGQTPAEMVGAGGQNISFGGGYIAVPAPGNPPGEATRRVLQEALSGSTNAPVKP